MKWIPEGKVAKRLLRCRNKFYSSYLQRGNVPILSKSRIHLTLLNERETFCNRYIAQKSSEEKRTPSQISRIHSFRRWILLIYYSGVEIDAGVVNNFHLEQGFLWFELELERLWNTAGLTTNMCHHLSFSRYPDPSRVFGQESAVRAALQLCDFVPFERMNDADQGSLDRRGVRCRQCEKKSRSIFDAAV